MEFIDYYQLLGIEQTASEDEVRKAIRATRKRFRQLEGSPDLDQRSMAEKKIAQIAQAEKTLTDRLHGRNTTPVIHRIKRPHNISRLTLSRSGAIMGICSRMLVSTGSTETPAAPPSRSKRPRKHSMTILSHGTCAVSSNATRRITTMLTMP